MRNPKLSSMCFPPRSRAGGGLGGGGWGRGCVDAAGLWARPTGPPPPATWRSLPVWAEAGVLEAAPLVAQGPGPPAGVPAHAALSLCPQHSPLRWGPRSR